MPPFPGPAAPLPAQTAGGIGRAGVGLAAGRGRVGGRAGWRAGLCTQGRLHARHTPSFYEAAAWWVLFCFFFPFCKDHHIK